MQAITPDIKGLKNRIQDLNASVEAAEDLAANQSEEEVFLVPDNEQQILTILQCIKKH